MKKNEIVIHDVTRITRRKIDIDFILFMINICDDDKYYKNKIKQLIR
jgi:hypothetical protein